MLIINHKRPTGVHHAINQMQCPGPMFISISASFLFCYTIVALCAIVLFDYCIYLLSPCNITSFWEINWRGMYIFILPWENLAKKTSGAPIPFKFSSSQRITGEIWLMCVLRACCGVDSIKCLFFPWPHLFQLSWIIRCEEAADCIIS